jgi:hypothetical protein
MPVRVTDHAPKFNGTTSQLRDFLETFDMHADDAGLLGNDHIMQLLRYLNSDDRELWSCLPEASLSDYATFIKEVKDMYPGWQGNRRYTVSDLQAVAQKHVNQPMTWCNEFAEYDCVFRKVLQPLKNKGTVGTAEGNRIFLEGFPSDFQRQTRTHLLIKFPDHHPQDPYRLKDVRAAALFLLPELPPPPQSASTPVNSALANLLPKTAQKPAKGTVTKHEYQRPSTPQGEGCIFCGTSDHVIGCCADRARYLEAGKCKKDENYRLVLPNGNKIHGHESTLKEKIDRFLESEKNTPTHSVQAGLFYRASPEVKCIIEVDPSAFVHTVVESDSDDNKDVCHIENAKHALALATAQRDQKRNTKGGAKGKSVCFDGVDVPSEPHLCLDKQLLRRNLFPLQSKLRLAKVKD